MTKHDVMGDFVRAEFTGADNQITLLFTKGRAFQSYDSVVAFEPFNTGHIYVNNNFDYSRTTSKHLAKNTRWTVQAIREALKADTTPGESLVVKVDWLD